MGRAWLTLSHGLSRPGAPSGSDGSAGRGRTPSKSERSERAPAGALSNASAEQPGRIAEACTSAMSLAARADAYLRCQAGVEAARAQVGLAVQQCVVWRALPAMDLEAWGASAPLHEAGLGLALERELGVAHRVELVRHQRSGLCFSAHLASPRPDQTQLLRTTRWPSQLSKLTKGSERPKTFSGVTRGKYSERKPQFKRSKRVPPE